MELQEILFSQGFGTRRVCAGLVQQGLVQVFADGPDAAPTTTLDATGQYDPAGLRFLVRSRMFTEDQFAALRAAGRV